MSQAALFALKKDPSAVAYSVHMPELSREYSVSLRASIDSLLSVTSRHDPIKPAKSPSKLLNGLASLQMVR